MFTSSRSSTIPKEQVQRICARSWWLILLRGIALFILGVLLVADPSVAVLVLVKFLGGYFLVDGMLTILKFVIGRAQMKTRRTGLLIGTIEFMTGILIFCQPMYSTIITIHILVYGVAIMAITFGVLGILSGTQLLAGLSDELASLTGGAIAIIAGGVFAVIFGVTLIADPDSSVDVYLSIMGIVAVIGGIFQMVASLQIRRIGSTKRTK